MPGYNQSMRESVSPCENNMPYIHHSLFMNVEFGSDLYNIGYFCNEEDFNMSRILQHFVYPLIPTMNKIRTRAKLDNGKWKLTMLKPTLLNQHPQNTKLFMWRCFKIEAILIVSNGFRQMLINLHDMGLFLETIFSPFSNYFIFPIFKNEDNFISFPYLDLFKSNIAFYL